MSQSKRIVFRENPYDVETIFESLGIAADQGKELLYVDRLIAELRSNPRADLTNLNYAVLNELELFTLEPVE